MFHSIQSVNSKTMVLVLEDGGHINLSKATGLQMMETDRILKTTDRQPFHQYDMICALFKVCGIPFENEPRSRHNNVGNSVKRSIVHHKDYFYNRYAGYIFLPKENEGIVYDMNENKLFILKRVDGVYRGVCYDNFDWETPKEILYAISDALSKLEIERLLSDNSLRLQLDNSLLSHYNTHIGDQCKTKIKTDEVIEGTVNGIDFRYNPTKGKCQINIKIKKPKSKKSVCKTDHDVSEKSFMKRNNIASLDGII